MDSKTETVSDREIAKFMNINLTLGFDVFWIVDEEDEMPDYKNGTVYSPSTNWDQLMPVVDTIEEIEEPHPSNNPEKGTIWPYQFEILSRSIVQIIDNRDDGAIVTINQDGLTKIQAVYKAVVEFIRWYNNSQSPDTIK